MKPWVTVQDEHNAVEEEPPSNLSDASPAVALTAETLRAEIRTKANGHWRDWRWQMRNRIRPVAPPGQRLPRDRAVRGSGRRFPHGRHPVLCVSDPAGG